VSRIEDGQRVRRKVSGRTKSEVKDRLKALHEELDQGVKPSVSYKVADALTDWCRALAATTRTLPHACARRAPTPGSAR